MTLIERGGPVMILLLLASVVMTAIIIERLLIFSKKMKSPPAAVENPGRLFQELQRGLPALHTIITIAPMLGLLGTVTGLIRCFDLLGDRVQGYDPHTVSLGISEALLTTAAGLIIAVVATIFYNYFTHRLERYAREWYGDEENKTTGENGQ
ncbi:MAG: MotA/TolQ/ExbB proton channel family protein [Firmicutes bacterium]|jgi:biopolymer transport protein ExbB|nr:MotA/TolQ/ExbB proton channel family protein [Bacillota bacterium]